MKRKKQVTLWMVLLLLLMPITVKADEKEEITDLIMDNIDINEVSKEADANLPSSLSFEGIFQELIKEDDQRPVLQLIGSYVVELLENEFAQGKNLFVQIIGIALIFSIINRLIIVPNNYVADMSFMMIYASMMVLLIGAFGAVGELVVDGIDAMLNFLEVLIPTYTLAMVLSGNATSASMFYTFTFGIIYVLEWGLKLIVIPGINSYVLLELLNHIYREDFFSKLAGLIYKLINYVLKSTLAIVAGVGLVQSLIGTAKDRIADSIVLKSISYVPGVGKIAGNMGEIFLGCGMLIKNGIGVTALIILVFLAAIPFVRLLFFDISYRFLAAVLQPVADRRIVEGLESVAKGGSLYLKLLTYGFLFFFISIAIAASASSFVH